MKNENRILCDHFSKECKAVVILYERYLEICIRLEY